MTCLYSISLNNSCIFQENSVQHFDGSVQNLQITSTYFAEEKRNLASYSVLQRLDIVRKLISKPLAINIILYLVTFR